MSEFSTDEVASILGCCRNNTSRKIAQLSRRLRFLLSAYRVAAAPGRSATATPKKIKVANVTEQVMALLETGGRLALADRVRTKRFVEQLVKEVLADCDRDDRATKR